MAVNGKWLVLKEIFVSARHLWVESALRVDKCVVDEPLDFVAKYFNLIICQLSHELLDAFALAGDLLSQWLVRALCVDECTHVVNRQLLVEYGQV